MQPDDAMYRSRAGKPSGQIPHRQKGERDRLTHAAHFQRAEAGCQRPGGLVGVPLSASAASKEVCMVTHSRRDITTATIEKFNGKTMCIWHCNPIFLLDEKGVIA